VFAAEAVSVMLQVWVYRWRKRRYGKVRGRHKVFPHWRRCTSHFESWVGRAAGGDAVLHPGRDVRAITLATLKVR